MRWAGIATVFSAGVLTGCPSLDIESLRFRCGADDQCIDGWRCDPIDKICVPASMVKDAGPHDAGTHCNPPCTSRATCDEDAGTCLLGGGMCTEVAPSSEVCGFSALLRSQIPQDFVVNGPAACSADGWVMTGARDQAAAIWHTRTFRADHFAFEMSFRIEPVAGSAMRGEGMTLAWVDAADTSVGAGGGFLGAAGLDGYYVELDTRGNISARCRPADEPSVPHVSFVRTTTSSGQAGDVCSDVEIIATATIAAAVQDGEIHSLEVEIDQRGAPAGTAALRVVVDETAVLSASVPFRQFDARFGVTAATGEGADAHVVRRLDLVCE